MMTQTPTASSFCHISIPAPDLGNAKAFYESVFGWTIQISPAAPNYWFFESGNVSGAFDASTTPAPKGVGIVPMLQVADLDATLDLIMAHGGTITQGRSKIGDASPGDDAYFLDPNGNAMGIYFDR